MSGPSFTGQEPKMRRSWDRSIESMGFLGKGKKRFFFFGFVWDLGGGKVGELGR